MNQTETLIKQAMLKQAERAPDPGPMLARLQHQKARQHRVLPLVLAVSSAAAVAVAVPVTIDSLRQGAGPAQAQQSAPGVPLRYQPTWLPDGYLPKARTVGVGYSSQLYSSDPMTREDPADLIESEPKGHTVSVTFARPVGSFAGVREAIQSNPDKVTINGATGVFNDVDAAEAKLVWMPAPNEVLLVSVSGTPNPREAAKRVAGSIRVAARATLHPVLRPGYFPHGTKEGFLTVSGNNPTDYTASAGVAQRPSSENPGHSAWLELSRQQPRLPGGEPIREEGVEGTYLPPQAQGNDSATGKPLGFSSAKLVAKLPGGWWLLIDAPEQELPSGELAPSVFTRKDLILMAKHARVHDGPQDWIGR